MTYPITISDLEKELSIHAMDGRSDALFRMSIAISQLGSLAAHLTHDEELNPGCRPYGSRAGEISDAGHAIIQVMTYCILRDISLSDAINAALNNLRDKDFMARDGVSQFAKQTERVCRGLAGEPCSLYAEAFVDADGSNLDNIRDDSILVTRHMHTQYIPYLGKVIAVVTDHGGMHSHAAIVCRELDIPFVVGCTNATRLFRTGDDLHILSDGMIGSVTKMQRELK